VTSEPTPRTDAPVDFRPTDLQVKAKVRFWTRQADNPLADSASVTRQIAIQVTGDQRLAGWWSLPGFADWFTNRDEFRERAEYLVECDDPKVVNAQVQLIKAIIEASGRGPATKKEVKYLDEGVGKLDATQLEQLLSKNTKRLASAKD
jgi:hypothetical protein